MFPPTIIHSNTPSFNSSVKRLATSSRLSRLLKQSELRDKLLKANDDSIDKRLDKAFKRIEDKWNHDPWDDET